jgi:flagellar biosynthesis activator protein FlaF
MSLRAYQQAAQRSETPRDVEYRLFAQVTRALMDVKSKPREDVAAWIDVLHWNRRMWATLADDCSHSGNALPEATRAHIISLSLFVHRHTSHVMRRQGDIDTLIDINRMMMQGLAGRADAA